MALNASDGVGRGANPAINFTGAKVKLEAGPGLSLAPKSTVDSCSFSSQAHEALGAKVKCQKDVGLGNRR